MRKSKLERKAVAVLRRRREALPGIGAADRSDEGRGHTALVTGASAGIGLSMAELLAHSGYDVVVMARREQRLKELQARLEPACGVRIIPLAVDLTAPEASKTIVAELERLGVTVDFLVNNAGYDVLGKYLEHTWDEHERFVRIMALGVAELTHHLLGPMVAQGWGRIINVTSVGAVFPGAPSMALYTASKSFVNKLSESIAAEYLAQGVHCTISAPGATQTELFEVTNTVEFWNDNLLPQISMMRPEDVVRQAYDACMAGKKIIVHGAPNKAWAFSLIHAPGSLRYRMVGFLAKMQPSS